MGEKLSFVLVPLIVSLPLVLKAAVDKVSREATLEILSLTYPLESISPRTTESFALTGTEKSKASSSLVSEQKTCDENLDTLIARAVALLSETTIAID